MDSLGVILQVRWLEPYATPTPRAPVTFFQGPGIPATHSNLEFSCVYTADNKDQHHSEAYLRKTVLLVYLEHETLLLVTIA